MTKKIRAAGIAVLAALWLIIAGVAWFSQAQDVSEAERRPLAQMPELSADSLLSGAFAEAFESYSLDQFPLRDTFRQIKSVVSYYVLNQKDNNGIYIADGYAAKQEYPLNQASVKNALAHFQYLYDTYLQGSRVVMAVVPDKGYYLAEENGYLVLDYEAMFSLLQEGMPYARFVDLTGSLSIEVYYHTDTHWRQENLLDAARQLTQALDVPQPRTEDYRKTQLERPFYGVYYGQAALPMEADTVTILESELLSDCRVYNHETGKYTDIYDLTTLESQDLYDVYLSGAQALLTIENPAGEAGKELIVFRDSFGSSIVPLLVGDYSKVTLVDTRYIRADLLGQYLDFHGQDVLMLYSTLILNNSMSLK